MSLSIAGRPAGHHTWGRTDKVGSPAFPLIHLICNLQLSKAQDSQHATVNAASPTPDGKSSTDSMAEPVGALPRTATASEYLMVDQYTQQRAHGYCESCLVHPPSPAARLTGRCLTLPTRPTGTWADEVEEEEERLIQGMACLKGWSEQDAQVGALAAKLGLGSGSGGRNHAHRMHAAHMWDQSARHVVCCVSDPRHGDGRQRHHRRSVSPTPDSCSRSDSAPCAPFPPTPAGETLEAPTVGPPHSGPPQAARSPRAPAAAARPTPSGPPYKIYISNLPWEVDEYAIERFFQGLEIRDIILLRHRDTQKPKGCFVEFGSVQDLTEALTADGAELMRRPISVSLAEARPNDRRGGGGGGGRHWNDGGYGAPRGGGAGSGDRYGAPPPGGRRMGDRDRNSRFPPRDNGYSAGPGEDAERWAPRREGEQGEAQRGMGLVLGGVSESLLRRSLGTLGRQPHGLFPVESGAAAGHGKGPRGPHLVSSVAAHRLHS